MEMRNIRKNNSKLPLIEEFEILYNRTDIEQVALRDAVLAFSKPFSTALNL